MSDSTLKRMVYGAVRQDEHGYRWIDTDSLNTTKDGCIDAIEAIRIKAPLWSSNNPVVNLAFVNIELDSQCLLMDAKGNHLSTPAVPGECLVAGPGKFENCPAWVPVLWGMALEGFADDDIGGVFFFSIDAELIEQCPMLSEHVGGHVSLVETDDGFVVGTMLDRIEYAVCMFLASEDIDGVSCAQCRCGAGGDCECGSEPFFSWSACECCGSELGGNRYTVKGYKAGEDSSDCCSYDVCTHCYLALHGVYEGGE